MLFDSHQFQVQVINFPVLQVRVFQGKQVIKSPICAFGGKYSHCRAGMCFLHMPSKESTIERCILSCFPFKTRVSWWLWLLFCHFRNAHHQQSVSTWAFIFFNQKLWLYMYIWTCHMCSILNYIYTHFMPQVSFWGKAYKAVRWRTRRLSQAHIVCCWSGSGCLRHRQQVLYLLVNYPSNYWKWFQTDVNPVVRSNMGPASKL